MVMNNRVTLTRPYFSLLFSLRNRFFFSFFSDLAQLLRVRPRVRCDNGVLRLSTAQQNFPFPHACCPCFRLPAISFEHNTLYLNNGAA